MNSGRWDVKIDGGFSVPFLKHESMEESLEVHVRRSVVTGIGSGLARFDIEDGTESQGICG